MEDDDALSVISSVDGSVIEAGGAYPGTRFPEVADAKRSAREQVAAAIASYEQQLAAEKAAALARMKYVHAADWRAGWAGGWGVNHALWAIPTTLFADVGVLVLVKVDGGASVCACASVVFMDNRVL